MEYKGHLFMYDYDVPGTNKQRLPSDGDTATLSSQAKHLRRNLDDTKQNQSRGNHRQSLNIKLQIRGLVEEHTLYATRGLTLGRDPFARNQDIDIDLSLYGAEEHGVSREHAQLNILDTGAICIVDMDSTNGTYLNDTYLEAFTPYLIGNGDVITLGTLAVKVMFEAAEL